MNKTIILASLLLGACAYQPNIPVTQQAKPSFSADLSACQAKQKAKAESQFGPLGPVSLFYNRSQMSDTDLQESNDALHKSDYIDHCMQQKGYAVQP
jgi:hypothetical protein